MLEIEKWTLPVEPSVVGDKIRQLREERRWTQKFVATRSGTSLTTVKRVEKGSIKNKLTVARVLSAFGQNLVELLTGRKCNRCGDCCEQFMIRIPVKKKMDVRGIMFFYNLHRNVWAQQVMDRKGNTYLSIQIREPCEMKIDHKDGTSSCKVYPMRPPICKEFPFEVDARTGPEMPICSMFLPQDKGKNERIVAPEELKEGEELIVTEDAEEIKADQ